MIAGVTAYITSAVEFIFSDFVTRSQQFLLGGTLSQPRKMVARAMCIKPKSLYQWDDPLDFYDMVVFPQLVYHYWKDAL